VATGVNWEKKTRRPFYWYQSKRRLLVRLYGRKGAVACLAAWLIGRSLWLIRRLLQPSLRGRETTREARDMIRAWFAPWQFDQLGCVAKLGDVMGQPPNWLSRND
jgi:hypothetical protein